jgi:hypothetical protein
MLSGRNAVYVWKNILPPSSGSKNMPSKKKVAYSSTLKMEAVCSFETYKASTILDIITSQKVVHFVGTAVGTLN